MLSKDLNAKNIINGYKTIKVVVDPNNDFKSNTIIRFNFQKNELILENKECELDKRFRDIFNSKVITYVD